MVNGQVFKYKDAILELEINSSFIVIKMIRYATSNKTKRKQKISIRHEISKFILDIELRDINHLLEYVYEKLDKMVEKYEY